MAMQGRPVPIFNNNNYLNDDYIIQVSPNFQNGITYYKNKDLATTSTFNYNNSTNTMSVNNISSMKLSGLQTPINSDDATNKEYVDSRSVDFTTLTNNSILATNTSKSIVSLSTNTYPSLQELSRLKGVTISVQLQLNNKENTIIAGTTEQYYRGDKTFQTLNQQAIAGLQTTSNVTFNNLSLSSLTGERALYIDESKNIRHSLVSTTELNYLFGVTNPIQTQFNNINTSINNLNTSLTNLTSTSDATFQTLTLNNTSGSNNTLILSRVNTANNNILFRASNIDKYTINYNHVYDSLSIFDVVNNRQLIEANNNRIYIRDKTLISSNHADTINANAILQLNSTTQAVIMPRMTQSQKLAIANPIAGMEVYDTTSKTKSYYNGTNWFIPSWISLNLSSSDSSPSIIIWDQVDDSPDTKIVYNAFNGTITFQDLGVYLVNATGNFKGTQSLEEYRVEIQFRQGSIILARGMDQVLKQEGASGSYTTFGCASISYLLNITSLGSTYNFFFDSEANSNITFDASSHAYIHRIS